MSNENEIESARRDIIAEITAKMDDDGLAITPETLAAKIEEYFPGFAYDLALDGATAELNATEAADSGEIDADDPDAIRAKVRELDQRAADLRISIRQHTDAVLNARGVLGQAINDFQRGCGSKRTQQDLIREHLAASLAERQRKADGLDPEPEAEVAGPSYLDRQSARFGDASTFARKQMRVGHSRGAYPASMRGARLPSNR